MNAYTALTKSYLRLTLRDRAALFFSYFMPLIFFFMFSEMMHAERGTATLVVNMVLTLGILGTGLFGAGMRAVVDRETNILRRFKVAPIGPAPMLVASMVVGLFNFIPVFVLILALAHFMYGMPMPANLISLTVFVLIGVLAFRAIGLIAASVANSAQEAQILIQGLYMPMLFLSGATIPVGLMPVWVQQIGQFLPATHLFTGMQSIMGSGHSIFNNLTALASLLLTIVVGGFIGIKLFRWEKEEKLPASAKLWVLAVLAPFVLMGMYQVRSKENVAKNKIFDRELSRREAYLVKDARIFIGDGNVIEHGAVLTRNGRIVEVYQGEPPSAKDLKATEIEGAGKTLLPGLIDVHVHLSGPGGFYEDPKDYRSEGNFKHELAAYLYSGVTAVRSVGDQPGAIQAQREKLQSGEQQGAELFLGALAQPTEENCLSGGDPRGGDPKSGAGPRPAEGSQPSSAYLPKLAVTENLNALGAANPDPLERSLVQQVGPPKLIAGTQKYLLTAKHFPGPPLDLATQSLVTAWRAGALLATGTDSGIPITFHGPAIHRELQLWVQAGIPPTVALQSATSNAARLLGAAARIGLIRKGYEATLLLVDGDPLKDIGATERISTLLFKGERIYRMGLFEDER
jgi:ABC-type multidrug transport system permease subunit